VRTATAVDQFANLTFVKLKDTTFLANQRQAGKIAGQALSLLKGLVRENTTKSLIELDRLAEEYIVKQGGFPTFKGYGTPPFPNSVCISVNHQLVHGVATDYVLQDGDIVSFDLGVTIHGAVADTALTCVYGQSNAEKDSLIRATEECLKKSIATVQVGARVGSIGNAIYKCAKGYGYNVYERYGGHGICISKEGQGIPHAQPFVANRAHPDEGIRIQAGMTIAIEPLLTRGPTDTYIAPDHWTVIGKQLNAHAEHTIFVHPDHTEIITERSS
jgi:methionyl aminopeptidase